MECPVIGKPIQLQLGGYNSRDQWELRCWMRDVITSLFMSHRNAGGIFPFKVIHLTSSHLLHALSGF